MRFLTRTLPAIALSLVLIVTGFAAASARGRLADDTGQVLVLCSQGGLVQITLDSQGRPTGKSHLCPDLVLNIMAALSAVLPDAEPVRVAHRLAHADPAPLPAGHDLPRNNARDPPLSV